MDSTSSTQDLAGHREPLVRGCLDDGFAAVIGHIPSPLVRLSLSFNILAINDSAMELLSWQDRPVVGESFFELCMKQGLPTPPLPNFYRIMQGEVITCHDILYHSESEHPRNFSWQICPYVQEGIVNSLFLIGREKVDSVPEGSIDHSTSRLPIAINAHKQSSINEAPIQRGTPIVQNVAEQLDANQAKSDFLASVSHDLRTPLNGILGMAEILKVRNHYPEQEEFVDGILQAGQNLLRYVEDILNFSKVEAGGLVIKNEPFDLREVVEKLTKMMTYEAQKKGVKLIISYPDNVPRCVVSDQHIIGRIILNLLGNAIKFTDKGYIIVSVECLSRQEKDAKLQIIVEDTGIGVPKDKINDIFDRFSRVEPSYKSRFQGSGLGLCIVKHMVNALDGQISVNSMLSNGSTFWCTLPFDLQEQSLEDMRPEIQYSNIRVLVVDDCKARGKTILKHVTSNESSMVAGSEAYSTLSKAAEDGKPYHLLVVDDESSVSPFNLAERVRSNKALSKLMMVLCAYPSNMPEEGRAKAAGFSRVLSKPLQPSLLGHLVKQDWQQWLSSQQVGGTPTAKVKLDASSCILLVEDNPLAQKISKSMLEDLGCQVDIASSGDEALRLVKRGYDMVFMDIGLPDQDGMEVTRKIRAYKNGINRVPIIAMTAHVSDADKRLCLESGMDDFISKPISYDNLERVLHHACKHQFKPERVVAIEKV